MKTQMFNRLVLSLMLGVATPVIAYGADFTFTVPVRLADLPPEIDAVKVTCTVEGLGGYHVGAGDSGEQPLGSTTPREFNGNVTVAFNASPTADASRADRYGCGFRLVGNVAGRRVEFAPGGGKGLTSVGLNPPVEITPSARGAYSNVTGTGDRLGRNNQVPKR